MNPTLQLTFTDGLIIGALFIAWIRHEYRWAQAVAEDRERRASRTTPRSAGKFFMDSIDWKGFPND